MTRLPGSEYFHRHLRFALVAASVLTLTPLLLATAPSATATDGADSAVICALPVCDIPATIAKLEQATPGERFNFIQNLRTKYRRSENPTEQENLRDFATQSRALSEKLNDEEWLSRESDYLLDQSLLALIKFRRPIESTFMTTAYKETLGESIRFEAVKYWAERISTIEDTKALLQMIDFGEKAKSISIQKQDVEWVAQEAEKLMTLGSAQLASLDPYHEGIYKITTVCDPAPADCMESYPSLAMMTAMETSAKSGYGLVVSFILPSPVEPAFLFPISQFTGGKGRMYGFAQFSTPKFPRPAEYDLKIDRETGTIEGILTDTRSPGVLRFKGTPIRRVKTLIDQTSGSTANVLKAELPGTYSATVGKAPGKLIMKEMSEGNLMASFIAGDGTTSIDFKLGYFVKSQSVLNLVALGERMNFVKAILRFEKINGKLTAKGFHFDSSDGTTEDWALEKAGSPSAP